MAANWAYIAFAQESAAKIEPISTEVARGISQHTDNLDLARDFGLGLLDEMSRR
jgi:hypothetical protein